ncbi:mitochondrial 37S ribosomal protein uS2m [Lipomyces oligophaga]|uniref:mitochondrial 37S ribosomal protein uS2m n=1 Tax=Lipomyces oligophaga TaxID=45792 RepID=UPI0034CF42AA
MFWEAGRLRHAQLTEYVENSSSESAKKFTFDEKSFTEAVNFLSDPSIDLASVLSTEMDLFYSREKPEGSGGLTGFENAAKASILEERSVKSKVTTEESESESLRKEGLWSQPDEPYTSHELYLRKRLIASFGDSIGTVSARNYKPNQYFRKSPDASNVTISMLASAGAHLGHNTQRLKIANVPFLLGIREGIHVINLDKTIPFLRRACRVVEGVVERGGIVLIVGTRDGHEQMVTSASERIRAYPITRRWIPGSITNVGSVYRTHKVKLVDMHDESVIGEYDEVPTDITVNSIKPDLIISLNPRENTVMLNEAAVSNIPTVAIIDTDSDPRWVTYPIPANDDSLRSVELILSMLTKAGQRGLNRRLKAPLYPDVGATSETSARQSQARRQRRS